jgi:hypothetical protein
MRKKTGHLMPYENQNALTVKAEGDFQLNNNQKAFLEIAMQSGPKRTDKAMCHEAGITPQTLCAWRKQPGFMAAWEDLPVKIIKRRLPNASSALMDEAEGGNVAAVKLALQAGGVVSSGAAQVHVGDVVAQQLNQYPGQRPGQQVYGDHRDFVLRADNAEQFKIIQAVSEKVAAEISTAEAKGEPKLTDQEHLLTIKLAAEKVMAEEVVAGQGEVIDVTPIQSTEAD